MSLVRANLFLVHATFLAVVEIVLVGIDFSYNNLVFVFLQFLLSIPQLAFQLYLSSVFCSRFFIHFIVEGASSADLDICRGNDVDSAFAVWVFESHLWVLIRNRRRLMLGCKHWLQLASSTL